MKENNYIGIILEILKYFIVIYGLYVLLVLFSNVFLKETTGEIIYYNKYQKIVIDQQTRFDSGWNNKGYVERKIWQEDIYYKYIANDINYVNSRVSNVFIYPNMEFAKDNIITVYYNKFFPKYSLIYKCSIAYFIVNLIPILIVFIVIFGIKKYTKTKK